MPVLPGSGHAGRAATGECVAFGRRRIRDHRRGAGRDPRAGTGEWIVDPDGAIVRAGLVRHYAAAHGLWQLDPRIAYLTGDTLPAGVRGFRVLDRLKYTEKTLRQSLSSMDCGVAEILVRGVDVDPAVLRPRLKLRGSRSLSVVLTRIGRTPTAFVCEPSR